MDPLRKKKNKISWVNWEQGQGRREQGREVLKNVYLNKRKEKTIYFSNIPSWNNSLMKLRGHDRGLLTGAGLSWSQLHLLERRSQCSLQFRKAAVSPHYCFHSLFYVLYIQTELLKTMQSWGYRLNQYLHISDPFPSGNIDILFTFNIVLLICATLISPMLSRGFNSFWKSPRPSLFHSYSFPD